MITIFKGKKWLTLLLNLYSLSPRHTHHITVSPLSIIADYFKYRNIIVTNALYGFPYSNSFKPAYMNGLVHVLIVIFKCKICC